MRLLSITTALLVVALVVAGTFLYTTSRALAGNETTLALVAEDLRNTKDRLDETIEGRDQLLAQNRAHIASIQGKQAEINDLRSQNASLSRDISLLVSANSDL